MTRSSFLRILTVIYYVLLTAAVLFVFFKAESSPSPGTYIAWTLFGIPAAVFIVTLAYEVSCTLVEKAPSRASGRKRSSGHTRSLRPTIG